MTELGANDSTAAGVISISAKLIPLVDNLTHILLEAGFRDGLVGPTFGLSLFLYTMPPAGTGLDGYGCHHNHLSSSVAEQSTHGALLTPSVNYQ
jgi:hypothetical protein